MNGAGPAYIYGPRGERIWTGTYGGPPSVLSYTNFGTVTTYPEQYDLYGIDGVKLGSYALSAYGTSGGVNPPPPFLFFAKQESRVYFAGRLMQLNGASVHPDRLGSLGTFYPYGEARNPASNPAVFATYRRDANNGEWDYAMNR